MTKAGLALGGAGAVAEIRATDANSPVVCLEAAWSARHCRASAAPNFRPDERVITPLAEAPERWVSVMPGTDCRAAAER
jgi:hypothetical protein